MGTAGHLRLKPCSQGYGGGAALGSLVWRGSGGASLGERVLGSSPLLLLKGCCCSVVSDSVRPQRRQPTRLPRLWDSPGKDTGVGCHCLLQSVKVKSGSEAAQSCPTVGDPRDCSPPGSSVPGISRARGLEWAALPSLVYKGSFTKR